MAVGGSVELSGDAGVIAETKADLTVLPLSVTLAGALVIAAGFLRPLRHRAVAGTRELAGWAARMAVLWVLALIGLAALARQTFAIPLGRRDASATSATCWTPRPRSGSAADIPLTLVFGLLWLAGLLVLALLVSRRAPLPARLVRFQESVRPAAFAMVALLLAYVVAGRGHRTRRRGDPGPCRRDPRRDPPRTAEPRLARPHPRSRRLLGGDGCEGPFGLPMPQVLD